MNQAVAVQPERRSVIVDMANRFGMEPKAFEAVVRATCIKPDKNGRVATAEEFAAFLLVAKNYGLNPLTKEIYAFTDNGRVIPIVSIDGWANLINSHPGFDGMSFVDNINDKGHVEAITCIMYRKDRSHPTEVTEYLIECKRDTSTWRQWPRRMLRHKSMIQAARYSFGFAGIYDPDEAERISSANDVSPPNPNAPRPQVSSPRVLTPPNPNKPTSEPPKPQETPPQAAFDLDAFRQAVIAASTLDEANAIYVRDVQNSRDPLEEDVLSECDRIMAEVGARFWSGDDE